MSFSDEFIKILDALGTRVGVAVDWTAQNVMPKLIELSGKLVAYRLVMDWLTIIFGLLIASIFAVLFIIALRSDSEEVNIFGGTGSFLALFLTLCISLSCVPELVACYTFPEKVVVDYVMKMKSDADFKAANQASQK